MAPGHSYKTTIKKLPETGEVEIKSIISAEEFDKAIKDTVTEIQKEIQLPGFRKGTAPEKMVREKIGEATLLREAAEHAISHAYGHILDAEKIDAIGYPKVSITKIAVGNPLEFTITTAVVPEISDFEYKKIAIKENTKKIDDVEKRRLALVDALVGGLDVIIPEALVESELNRMEGQMKQDIERMGLKFEDYLKHLKQGPADLRKDWRADAIKRVKLNLALVYIAKQEKILADKEKVDTEIKNAKEHHKDIDVDRALSYFEHIFLNQAVFEFLEKQK